MTRTFKCTHSFNIKRMHKPYDSPPNTSGLHKATGSTAVKSSGREVVTLCNQLGGVNNRQMGNTGSERISNSFHQSASSGALAKPSYVLSRAKPANTRGSEYTVRKGVVVRICNPQPQESFYSTLFLVPKKRDQMRSVINLKKLNEWVTPQHFKMEGMGTLKELLRTNNWMVKVDLKDAYFTIPVHPSHHPYLRFMVGQEHYQFTCLSFSLSCAPWVFTKVMKPIAIFLRSMGAHMMVYIDDILLMGTPQIKWSATWKP